MFPATITINSLADMQKIMAVLHGEGTAQAVLQTERPEGNAQRGRIKPEVREPAASTTVTAAAGSTATPIAASSAPAAAAPAAGDTPPSYQDTANAVTKVSRTKGRDTAVALLAEFGVTKLPDAKPEQFAAIIAACDKALV